MRLPVLFGYVPRLMKTTTKIPKRSLCSFFEIHNCQEGNSDNLCRNSLLISNKKLLYCPRKYFSVMNNNNDSTNQSTKSELKSLRLKIPTAADMEEIGAFMYSLLSRAKSPDMSVDQGSLGLVIFLKGDLGAGKTVFARGFVRSATGDETQRVTSPTYLLSNTYKVTSNANILLQQ